MEGEDQRIEGLVHGLLSLAEGLASKLTLDERLSHVCRSVVSLLSCDRSSIFLRDGGYYRGCYNYGNPPDIAIAFPSHKVSVKDRLVAQAVSSGKPVVVNDARVSPLMRHNIAEEARIQAIVVAPFFDANGEADGFITAEYNESLGWFSDLDSSLLLGAARLAQGARQIEAADSQRANAVRTAQALETSVRRLEQLEAVGRVAGGVAHDLNNVLTVVLGNVDLLRLSDDLTDQDRRIAREAADAGRRAAGVVRELLAFGSRQPLDARPLSLAPVIQRIQPMLERLLPANQTLKLVTEDPLPLAMADPVQVERALMNLVLNARDAMPTGGTISITLDESPHDEEFSLRHFGVLEGPMLRLRVADQGRGIEPSQMERIFEPFYSTKGGSANSGLGLSTVFGIMRQSDGHIVVDSERGGGAEFSLFFPLSHAPATTRAKALPLSSRPHHSEPLRVLVADDDPSLNALLRMIVEKMGHQVVASGTASEVLDEVVETEPKIDLLITDYMMPDLNGVELSQKLEAIYPQLRVLILSGFAPQLSRLSEALRSRNQFLAKPFSPQDLENAILELMAHEVCCG